MCLSGKGAIDHLSVEDERVAERVTYSAYGVARHHYFKSGCKQQPSPNARETRPP